MLFPAVCFISIFLYFAPFPDIYPYIDCALQYAICFFFPVYYLFFRLLTIDDEFSVKKHLRYLIIPFILATCYCVGIFFTPWVEYKTWLFNENTFTNSPYIQYLSITRDIIRILFLVQFIVSVIGNQLLIQKYGVKAEQFYSDMEEKNYKNAKLLNYLVIFMFLTAFIAYALSYGDIISKEMALKVILSISSTILFLIGFFGIKQEPINPTFEFVSNADA
jgi:hypothetical protein